MRQSFWLYLLVLGAVALFLVPSVAAVLPVGATVTENGNQTAPPDAPGSQAAIAGNVSNIDLNAFSTTQAWQGYYGNVTGTIQLADGSDNVMYNWSDVSPRGQVYASTNSSINWLTIQCFNFTATGTQFNATGETPGGTNLKGMNLTQLQNEFGIQARDYDSVNNTFYLIGSSTDHPTFYTANLAFNGSACQTTRVYDNSGQGQQGNFSEVIQYDPQTTSVVWTAILNENAPGFDGNTHDFEMLVPENGHGTNTATTTYYFYLSIQ